MSNGEWVVCPLKEAEGFRFKGAVYSITLNSATIEHFSSREVDWIVYLRVEVDRCVKVSACDFDVFGIEPVKFVKVEPMKHVGKVEVIGEEDRYDNGMSYTVPIYGIALDAHWKDKEVIVTEVIK